MKTKLLSSVCAVASALGTLAAPRAAAAVSVYGEASSSGPAITVNIFADIPTPLLSFGIRVRYEARNVGVTAAAKNTAAWYFSDGKNPVPYLDPDTSTPGEVLILGGKMDGLNPLEGVTGRHVLLGSVTFARLAPATPQFSLDFGRPIPYANFVTTSGTVLDAAADGIVFGTVAPDPADVDLDGLPDAWEIHYFGGIEKYDWSDDPDQDGFNNRQEYIADTNPTDPASYLRITAIQPQPGGVSIAWQGGVEATQYLQQRLTLEDGKDTWLDIFTNPPPTTINGNQTLLLGTNSLMFYRLRATR